MDFVIKSVIIPVSYTEEKAGEAKSTDSTSVHEFGRGIRITQLVSSSPSCLLIGTRGWRKISEEQEFVVFSPSAIYTHFQTIVSTIVSLRSVCSARNIFRTGEEERERGLKHRQTLVVFRGGG